MKIIHSKLREKIYSLLKQVLKTRSYLGVREKEKLFGAKKLDNLRNRNIMKVDPEDLIEFDWSKSRKPK
jgi:hypothetical protein